MTEVGINPKSAAVEAALLKAMTRRENYATYNQYVDYKRVLEPTALLLKDYKKYYDLYPERNEIDLNVFYTQFSQHWHTTDLENESIAYFRDYVIPAVSAVDSTDVDRCLIGFIEKQTADELNRVSSKAFDLEKLREILGNHEKLYNEILKTTDLEVQTMSTVDFNVLDKTEGLPWWLPTLQEGIGSLVKGQLVVVSADSGTGKSAAMVSQVAHLLPIVVEKGLGPILYFNSEGTSADVFGRVCSNIFRDQIPGGFEDIVNKREAVRKQFLKRYGDDKLLVIQIAQPSVDWVLTKIVKYKPSLVIIDITDTLAKEEDVTSLKKVFDRLRVISGLYCPIIGTTQAGDQTYMDKETGQIHSRKWLSDKALYGSKTGKGGAADTIITIGKDDNNSKLRYISVPKKKRGNAVNITAELIEEYSFYKELSW